MSPSSKTAVKAPAKATKTAIKADESAKAMLVALVEATIRIMDELVLVMTTEIDLVSARRLEEHKELLKTKQRLTMDYRANVKTLAAEPEKLRTLPEKIRAALKEAGQKLADVTDRNAKYMRAAVLATQRLIQNIVSIVKQEALPAGSYRNPKDMQLGLNPYSPTCKPVAVIRTA